MLGVYLSIWVLTLMDLRTSGYTYCMDRIGSTSTSTWCTGAVYMGDGSVGGILVSTISITCGSLISTFTPGISVLSTSDGSTPGILTCSTSDGSTPGILTSPIGRPRLLVKNQLLWFVAANSVDVCDHCIWN